jgi:transposase
VGGQYRDRKIHQIDPETGAILRTIESNRFVTGVTWVDGELWHGTWEGDESELRRIDPGQRRRARAARDAARRRRQRARVRRRRLVLLRRRLERKGARGAAPGAWSTGMSEPGPAAAHAARSVTRSPANRC